MALDVARLKSIAVLAYNFNLHLLRSALPRKKPDQAELFKSYFRDDRITPFTEEEHRDLTRFEDCINCALCPAHCRVMQVSGGLFKGPRHVAVSASRSHPDFVFDLDSIALCAVCGQCEPICPQSVPVAEIARSMRSILWRIEDELPEAWIKARRNLERYGNIYGEDRVTTVGDAKEAEAVLVLGPFLRTEPRMANEAARALELAGVKTTLVEEGTAGGVAWSLGLDPDTGWLDPLAATPQELVIAADPETWLFLKHDERLAAKRVALMSEILSEMLPANLRLKAEGPVTVHDPYPLARHSLLWKRTREMISSMGGELVEMRAYGPWAPPAGWEGGIDLVEPELARELAGARLSDALSAGAATIVTESAADAKLFIEAREEGGPEVAWLPEALIDSLE